MSISLDKEFIGRNEGFKSDEIQYPFETEPEEIYSVIYLEEKAL